MNMLGGFPYFSKPLIYLADQSASNKFYYTLPYLAILSY